MSPDKVKFLLYSKNHPENYTEIDPANPEELVESKDTIVFILHGWRDDGKWSKDLKNAFLTKYENYYVVEVDWSDYSKQNYARAAWHSQDVGRYTYPN